MIVVHLRNLAGELRVCFEKSVTKQDAGDGKQHQHSLAGLIGRVYRILSCSRHALVSPHPELSDIRLRSGGCALVRQRHRSRLCQKTRCSPSHDPQGRALMTPSIAHQCYPYSTG